MADKNTALENDLLKPRHTFTLEGHEGAEKAFLDAYNSDKMHHAWLVTGPKGIGKASLAFKIARFMLHNSPLSDEGPGLFGDILEKACPEDLNTDPESAVNKLISASSHGDLVIVERRTDEKTGKVKAEIVVDDVRKLQNFYNKTSVEGGWRIVIIDSADEMNRASANALLKMLEEPPKNSLLILLAHAPGKLLPTIKSRCRHMRLKPLDYGHVSHILSQQFPDLNADEIAGYATLCNGSPGYGANLVQHEGLALYKKLLELLYTMPSLDVPLAHKLADELAGKTAQEKYTLFGELLTHFINRMVRHISAGDQSDIRAVMTGELELMQMLGTRIPLDRWVDLWEKVSLKMGRINLDRKQVVLNVLTTLNQAV